MVKFSADKQNNNTIGEQRKEHKWQTKVIQNRRRNYFGRRIDRICLHKVLNGRVLRQQIFRTNLP